MEQARRKAIEREVTDMLRTGTAVSQIAALVNECLGAIAALEARLARAEDRAIKAESALRRHNTPAA